MPDVTIIGAGPGGSTAAILLARAGWDVTLIEQSRFPRDKVCGECLSALGFDVLSRLGLTEAFRKAGAIPLEYAAIHAPSGRSMRIALPKPMWGLSRRVFDQLLLDAAIASGARIRQPARCESLSAVLQIRDLTTNRVESSSPAHVILADGKAAFADDTPAPSGDFGIKAHFANVDGPRDAIELFGVRGSYGGLAAIEDNRWNAAFSVPGGRLKAHRGDIDALFTEIVSENATLAGRLARAERVGDWLTSPLPRFAVRNGWPQNVIPVGNAAAALEPIGGEGMGLAMRSAELAAAALITGNPDSLATEFRSLWRTRRAACRAAALAASSPPLIRLVTATGLPGAGQRLAMRLIGK